MFSYAEKQCSIAWFWLSWWVFTRDSRMLRAS